MRTTGIAGIGGLLILLLAISYHLGAQPQSNGTLDVAVCYNKTTMLVFPARIDDADMGSGDILIRTARKHPNVLKVKAAKENFPATNLSVFTDDGRLFSINVRYEGDPSQLKYDFAAGNSSEDSALAGKEGTSLKPATIREYAKLLAFAKPLTRRPKAKSNLVRLNLRGVYITGDILFFRFDIRNKSDIPYDIYFTRFYLRDRSRSKRTSNMEKEIDPVHVYFTTDSIVRKDHPSTMVVALEKFTIADQKYFSVELYEKNGDRNLACKIKGRDILKARTFSPPSFAR